MEVLIEISIYLLDFTGVTLISLEWAKYGFWELSLQGLNNKKIFIGLLCGIISGVIDGIAYRKIGFIPNIKLLIVINTLWPFLLISFMRKLMPPGQFEFNKARERINFWMRSYYLPGKILKKGDRLKRFSRAKETIELLKKAILAQQKYGDIPRAKLNIAIAYGEMGLLYRMMNMWEEAKEVLNESLTILNELNQKLKEHHLLAKEVKSSLSLIIFRLGEIDHANGRFDIAIRRYRESIAIDKEIGDEESIKITELLLNELQSKRIPNG